MMPIQVTEAGHGATGFGVRLTELSIALVSFIPVILIK